MAYQHSSGGTIGLDFHYLGATDVSLGSVSTNVDGWIVSLSLGYGF